MDLRPNSLAIRFPELEKEWHPDNVEKFCDVSYGSKTKYKWICAKGHTWNANPNSRTGNCSGCLECSRVSNANSLATKAPELEKEWHSDNDKKFWEVAAGSNTKYKWICAKGHVWDARPFNRVGHGSGCSECSGKKASSINSLATKAPELESEWHSDNDKKFWEVAYGSHTKYKWICAKGHTWDAPPCDRTRKRSQGCPECPAAHSKAELTIFEAVKSRYPDAVNGKRGLLRIKRLELDIYIPSLRKAIEYDGTYWHSLPGGKEKDQRKNQQCADAGILLLRIAEADYKSDRQGTITKTLEWLQK